MHDVFISYSSKDKKVADSICHKFESEGIRCWYAPRDILPGVDWREAIMSAISEAKVFILVYSQNSNQSRQVLNEVTAAFDSSCVIIPFRLEDVEMAPALSFYLSNVHWMDAMFPPRMNKIADLTKKVQGILNAAGSNSDSSTADDEPKYQKWLPAIAASLAVLLIICIAALFLRGEKPTLDSPPQTDSQQEALPSETATPTTQPVPDYASVIDTACKSAVQIKCYLYGSCVSGASGFACFDDHVIVTNAHVVTPAIGEEVTEALNLKENTQELHIEITTESGLTYTVTDVLVCDTEVDIAILSTTGSHGIPLLEPGSTDDLRRGEKLIMIEAFRQGENTIVLGEYTGITTFNGQKLISFSKSLSVGNSGSPLLKEDGKVIGILFINYNDFSCAVPIDAAQELWLGYTNSQ